VAVVCGAGVRNARQKGNAGHRHARSTATCSYSALRCASPTPPRQCRCARQQGNQACVKGVRAREEMSPRERPPVVAKQQRVCCVTNG